MTKRLVGARIISYSSATTSSISSGCRLQIADCRLQIADCRLQIADCRLVVIIIIIIIISIDILDMGLLV